VVLDDKTINAKDYEEFKELVLKKHKRLPMGHDILQYWAKHPDIAKQMCPNPAKINKNGSNG